MTHTTTDAAEARALPVIQADRDAAANVIDTYEGKQRYASMVRAGNRDAHPLCIAFARHRLATAEAASGAKGTFACPVCGDDTPHHHAKEPMQCPECKIGRPGHLATCSRATVAVLGPRVATVAAEAASGAGEREGVRLPTDAAEPSVSYDEARYVGMVLRLINATEQVLRISDRQHVAWDEARSAITLLRSASLPPATDPAMVERPSDDELEPHLPESIRAAKRCGIQRSDWLAGWFVPWSPRNDNQNAEGPWSDWVALAHAILTKDAEARAALAPTKGDVS